LKPTITQEAALTPRRILIKKKNFKTSKNPKKRNKKRSKKVMKKRKNRRMMMLMIMTMMKIKASKIKDQVLLEIILINEN
jgi:hypothetical protein